MIPVNSPDVQITIHEVLGGNARDLEELLQVHTELFPNYTYYQSYMRDRALQPPDHDPRFIEHWWLLRANDKPAAVRFFKYALNRDCGIALAIGILPEYRGYRSGRSRLSEAILRAGMEQLKTDAETCKRPEPVGMVTEIEDYLHSRYFEEYGYVRLPLQYLEPSYTQEAKAFLDTEKDGTLQFRCIQLGILPMHKTALDLSDKTILENIVFALLIDHYGLSEDHWVVRRALDSIQLG